MKELGLIKERVGVPPAFLTTVTCNTFRPEYYFNKTDVVEKAVSVHKNFVTRDPLGYKTAVEKAWPIMLDVHKILSTIYLWDRKLTNDGEIVAMLTQVRPDHIPDFWITIKEHRKALGLQHKTLSSSARKLVWKFMESIAEERGTRTVALWLMKNKKTWNKALYYAHTKLENSDLEWLTAKFAFGRKKNINDLKDDETKGMLQDIETMENLRKENKLTIEAFKNSGLPYRMLEGYASGQINTTTKQWYWAILDKMTNYEVLRRTDAMNRAGFFEDYEDLYKRRVARMARWIEPVAVASVIIQHQQLREMLINTLNGAMDSINLEFPEKSVVLCDRSRSMKLKKTRPQPRVLWELVAQASYHKGIPTYCFNDKPEEFGGYDLQEGYAIGPTSISRALLKAKEHEPEWIFLLSDMQQNIPFRGHEKNVARKLKANIVTLNPTVNPLEPEAATRLETDNELFLPINGLRQFEKILQVLKD